MYRICIIEYDDEANEDAALRSIAIAEPFACDWIPQIRNVFLAHVMNVLRSAVDASVSRLAAESPICHRLVQCRLDHSAAVLADYDGKIQDR